MEYSKNNCPIYEHVQEVFKKSKKGDVIVFANDTYKVFDNVKDYECYVKDLIDLGLEDISRAVPHFQIISNDVNQKMVFVCKNTSIDELKEIKIRLLTYFKELKDEDIVILPIEPLKHPKLFGKFDDCKSIQNFDVILNSIDSYNNNRKKIDDFKHDIFCENEKLADKITHKSIVKTSSGEKYIIVNITLPQLSGDYDFNADNLKKLPAINITINDINNGIIAGTINASESVLNNCNNQEKKETVNEIVRKYILSNPPTDKQSQNDYFNEFIKHNNNIKLRNFNNLMRSEGFVNKRVKDFNCWSKPVFTKVSDKVKS
jgi:hypothetical protein